MSINVVVEGKIVILFFQIFREKFSDLFPCYFSFAALLRTVEGDEFVDDFFFGVFTEAVAVEHMSAAEQA